VAYLEGGRNDGLAEGMKLDVKALDPSSKPTAAKSEDAQVIAELEVASVALSSAVSEIHNPTRPVAVGDWAYLSSEDTQGLIAQHSLSATRKYPVVLAFSEGDTLDDEAQQIRKTPALLKERAGEDPLQLVLELLPDVPAGKLAIADVDVATRDEVIALERAGFDAVLATGAVGELVGATPPDV